MLISSAFAQQGGSATGGLMELILPFAAIFGVFYFLLIRPQQKKVKQHKEMIANIKRGDRIVTGGGIVGRVARVEGGDELMVEIAQGVRVRVLQSTVSNLLVRGEAPAREETRKPKEETATEKQIATRDYYSILGVPKTTTGERISKTYRKLATKYNPDSNPNDSQLNAKFDEINEAYETLKDPKLRKIYDAVGHDEYVKIQNS